MKKIAYLTAAAILSGAVFLNATAADLASDAQKTTENQTISIDQNSNAPSSLQCGYFKLKQSGQKIFSSEIHSVKASSEEDLVQKTEEWMRNFTKTSGHEACANICKSPEGEFSAIFTTSHSQIGCAVSRDRCLDGFSPTGRTIHSHPALPLSNSIVLSKTDQLFFQARSSSHTIVQKRMRVDPRTFSKEDWQAGSGYLVTENDLLFQDGKSVVVLTKKSPK